MSVDICGLAKFGKTTCRSLCCMMILGPILVTLGTVALIRSGTDTRGSWVAQYNSAVRAWQQDAMPDTDAGFVVSADGRTSNATLDESMEDPVPAALAGEQIDVDYPQARFATSRLPDGVPPEVPFARAPSVCFDIRLDSAGSASLFGPAKQCHSASGGKLPGIMVSLVSARQTGDLWSYYGLARVCMAVDDSLKPAGSCTGVPGEYAIYRQASLGELASRTFSLQTLRVEVRSVRDPYVVACKATGQTPDAGNGDCVNFGESQGSQRLVGVIMLLAGAGMTLLPLAIIVVLYKCCKQRRETASADDKRQRLLAPSLPFTPAV